MKNDIGKLPPQAVDVEEVVLGAILIDQEAFDKASDFITEKSFYKQANAEIYKAISFLRSEKTPVDMITVTQQLKKWGKLEEVGGAFYITTLTSRVTYGGNIETHAAIVQQKYLGRELIKAFSRLQNKAFSEEEDVFDIITEAQETLQSLTGFNRSDVKHISEILRQVINQIDNNLKTDRRLNGIPTGFSYFDKFSSGLQKGDLIVIAAETSNGKTSLAINITVNAAMANFKTAFYSYEMSNIQLAARMLSGVSSVSSKNILYNPLSEIELMRVTDSVGKLEAMGIYIDDIESRKYDYLEKSIRAMVTREGVDLIVVDYIQLIKTNSRNGDRVKEIAEIANNLKGLAGSLNVPIIVISQLSRDRQNPKPSLARLKGSGDIENAADIVWLLWSPENYGWASFEVRGTVHPASGLSHHIIDKGRNIGTAEFVLEFEKPYTLFKNHINTPTYEPATNPY